MLARVSRDSPPYPSPSKSATDKHISTPEIESNCSAKSLQPADFDSRGPANAAGSELLDGIADRPSESQIELPHQDSAEPSTLESPVGQNLLGERVRVPSELRQLSSRLDRSDKGRLRATSENIQETFFPHQ